MTEWRGLEAKSGENTFAKLTYLLRAFVEELGNAMELSDATCITKVSISGLSAAATNFESRAGIFVRASLAIKLAI